MARVARNDEILENVTSLGGVGFWTYWPKVKPIKIFPFSATQIYGLPVLCQGVGSSVRTRLVSIRASSVKCSSVRTRLISCQGEVLTHLHEKYVEKYLYIKLLLSLIWPDLPTQIRGLWCLQSHGWVSFTSLILYLYLKAIAFIRIQGVKGFS